MGNAKAQLGNKDKFFLVIGNERAAQTNQQQWGKGHKLCCIEGISYSVYNV
jgi:hypothetical protein